MKRLLPAGLVTLVLLFACACGRPDGTRQEAFTRSTLADGSVLVTYRSLPGELLVKKDLTIGVADGEPEYLLGDVRGIDATSDGTIYIFDYQPMEIRAYNNDGRYIGVVAGRGDGPGEIREANGFKIVGDSLIWIHDYRKDGYTAIDLNGAEKDRVPLLRRGYDYIWNGDIDNAGRIWKPDAKYPRSGAPEGGLRSASGRLFMTSIHPATKESDSVFVGIQENRGYVVVGSGGWAYYNIPFDPPDVVRVDPENGFWRVDESDYRIRHLDSKGDTVLTIEADVAPIPVTSTDHESYIASIVERNPDRRATAEAVVALMPDQKPAIQDVTVDGTGRLWVRRTTEAGADARFDVFTREGVLLASVALDFPVNGYMPIRVRGDRIYALSTDSLGVPSVVRTEQFSLSRGA
ncbi:MAG: hypothetical protein R2832_08410 [Rhodothermales bacterium]